MSYFLHSSDSQAACNYTNRVSLSDHCAILSLAGLRKCLKSRESVFDLSEGRFSLSLGDGVEKLFITDRKGQGCWFYYNKRGFWAVSNSLYALAIKLKERKRLYWNKTGGLFYNIQHSLGAAILVGAC